ncbi:MAG: response regulator [Bdellovibrionales bacterium]|nr:response regulator [Bdellovibrionales bacterium]
MKLAMLFGRSPFPCAERALCKVIGRRVFEDISAQCPDRRFLFGAASVQSGKTEREMMNLVADILKCGVAPRVLPTELEHLPAGLSLQTLRDAGCIAIIRNSVFRGVVCVNPARIPPQLQRYENLEYLLAPWDEIAVALVASERAFRLQQELRSSEEFQEREETFERVLSFLADEVERYSDTPQVRISLEGGVVQYIFQTSRDGKTGRGEIHRSLIPQMEAFLGTAGTRPQIIAGREFLVRELEKGCYYEMYWTSQISGQVVDSLENGRREEEHVPVLLIDDSETFGSVVERFFSRQNISVQRRTSARLALQELQHGKLAPRIIVCDLHMPGMNGIEFVREIRRIESLQDVSIVMLTSDDEVANEIALIRLGIEAYIRKSSDPRILCAHVERVLDRSKDRHLN